LTLVLVLTVVVQAFRPAVAAVATDSPKTTKDDITKWMTELVVMDLEAAAETAARLKRWEFLLTAAPVLAEHAEKNSLCGLCALCGETYVARSQRDRTFCFF